MDHRRAVSPETALASDIFDKFCSANTLKGILSHYRQLCLVVRTKPTHFPDFYPRLRAKLSSWRAQGLWSKFEKRATQKCYGRGKACFGTRVLIIGAGPCGLRVAIEAQLLGAKVVLVEKRDRFSRNNVLHLWPFVITDLKALGAKKFYGKFCAGSIDHISIRQIQCILLKVALLLGVEVHEGVGFEGIREPTENEGWRAFTSPADHPVSHYTFDVLIGADGRRNTLDGFKRKALRAKLAIAITANFINKHTEAEARVKEISGVSYIFNQKFFNDLCDATAIDLENIVYYKDETHYFVMTAKKQSLLHKGVLLQDYADTAKLLSHENISTEALMVYALEAATFATEYQLPDIEFAVNHYGQPDVAMFDFTAMYAAENACRVVQKKNHKLLMTLVGDSLLEPFWPTGSGCARGFLSSFDACWMMRSWSSGLKSVLEVAAERESIYRLLGQTTPENLHKEHVSYTIDPHTRYPNLNLRLVMPFQVKSLYESDETIPEGDSTDCAVDPAVDIEKAPRKRRRDSVIAIDSLLGWLREQVLCYNLEVIDVREAFVQGDVLCAIIHRFRPDLIEYPLPSEENIDTLITAAFRNQLAFDIFHQEYGLPHAMTGYDSVQFGSSDFLALVTYLSQIYEIFRGEIPQTKYFRSESGDEVEENVPQSTGHLQALKQIRMAVTAKHHFAHKSTARRSRVSTGRESKDGDTESYRRHKKRRSDERSSRTSTSGDRLHSTDTLSARAVAKESRKMKDRMFDVERFMKSMRLLQLSDRSGSFEEENDTETQTTTEFHDESMHLYRQTVPDFDERLKTLEQKLIGRESKPVFGKSLSEAQSESEKLVPGLAKDLEAKFKGRAATDKQKPKDMIRAIGKIEKSDWNVQLIEKKMAEIKSIPSNKKDRENKVPRWSREAYDDKRDAMKRKMDGTIDASQDEQCIVDENVRKLGNKLKHGNALDVGQRGCNKVSAMAEQLIHKLERPKQTDSAQIKQTTTRPVFEMPKKGRADLCHFCKERVYVVERMTAEGKFFHRNCFRCEYCNTSLRIGNYVFDREGRYGERFYCSPHYTTVRMYGWKKFDTELPEDGVTLLVPPSQQILSEMDERGTTPERVEFENSVDFASEEELLNEMDEDEWTDRNFGSSNVDNTSDEASDLSDDEEVTPEGNNAAQPKKIPQISTAKTENEGACSLKTESSDSDTEVASEEDENEEDEEEEEEEDDEDEGDDEYEEECGGSTEIETDSEFAEDPPNSVPGSIPTIVVDAPEQLLTKLTEAGVVNHAKHVNTTKEPKVHEHRGSNNHKFKDIYEGKSIELVKKGAPERQLPVVTSVPKRWEPLSNNPERLASKVSLELKKKYLQGGNHVPVGNTTKKASDPAAQNQFRSVLDMISEQQKLLQPASKPSATMQAFLDGSDRLVNKPGIAPISLNRNLTSIRSNLNNDSPDNLKNEVNASIQQNNGNTVIQPVLAVNPNPETTEKTLKDTTNLIISSFQNNPQAFTVGQEILEKQESECALNKDEMDLTFSIIPSDMLNIKLRDETSGIMTTSDAPSFSNSETDTNTVINANDYQASSSKNNLIGLPPNDEVESGSDTEVGSAEPFSDLDDLDEDDLPQRITHEPPRVEIEDEFGVTKSLDPLVEGKKGETERIHSKQIKNQSSSDSSLNSGIFLETEMSDYVKEESTAGPKKPVVKRHSIKKSKKDDQRARKLPNEEGPCKPKGTLSFDLEALDFADIDGVSSPDDVIGVRLGQKAYGSGIKCNTSSPHVAQNAPKCRPESQSSSITSPSEDDERSSTSLRDRSTSDADLSDNNGKILEGDASPIIVSKKHVVPALERVVPFSGVRDSLDYRKSRGITSLRHKELYSNYAIPSVKPEEIEISATPVDQVISQGIDCEHEASIQIPSTDESGRSIGSPATTRKLNQIHKERVKQNDLIRSMVLGRIRRNSPEKSVRRNSKGSPSEASPILSEPNVEQSGDDTDSRISSDAYQDGNTSEDCDKSRDSSVPYQDYQQKSSSDISSGHDIPHRPMAESVSNNSSDDSSGSQLSKALLKTNKAPSSYEPIFTSSPRFRNRPKFEGIFNVPQSKTEPHTPTAVVNELHYPIEDNGSEMENESEYSVKNPLFCRSMPNLVANFLPRTAESDFNTRVVDKQNGHSKKVSSGPPDYEYPPNPCLKKNNPFLVSPNPQEINLSSGANEDQDDFINLHLKFRSKDELMAKMPRSIYTNPSYTDSGYSNSPQPSSSSSSVMTMRPHQTNVSSAVKDQWNENKPRARANTVANLLHSNQTNYNRPLDNSPILKFSPNSRHSIDNSDTTKVSKSKAISSDTLIDTCPYSEINRRTSVPDISANTGEVIIPRRKSNKNRDRDRRRSLIQTVSDFFTSRTNTNNNTADKVVPTTSNSTGQSSLTTSTSSSSIMSPTKEKFSLFKLAPKLLQGKEKKNSPKSKESAMTYASSSAGQVSTDGKEYAMKPKTDFAAYLAQPELVIQRLTASPTNMYKDERTEASPRDVENCATQMADLSVNSPRVSKRQGAKVSIDRDAERNKRAASRAREIQEIQLQLESIETDQRGLESRGVVIEKKLRGEEQDEQNRTDAEIMEEWFELVRGKTKLARFEKELLVRAQELELERKREHLEEQLETSLTMDEEDKNPSVKQRENEIIHELARIDDEHNVLLISIHSDMEKYEDSFSLPNLDFSLSPGTSRLESDV